MGQQDYEEEIMSSTTEEDDNNNLDPAVAGGPSKVAVQCLMKGDKVFSMPWTEEGIWSSLIRGQWRKNDYKFDTGEVVINKDWSAATLSFEIRWNNGSVEKLMQKSSKVAYHERVFVLDREFLHLGSKVSLVGQSDLEGTVVAKRYLATGSTIDIEGRECIFEDIDITKLAQETHGNGYKDKKIIYRGWFGVTSGFRTRVHMQSQVENGVYFTIAVDGKISQQLRVGDKINLGFKILRGAEFVGGDAGSGNWLVNFFKFYNTTATVVDFEIDQLSVYWIGKAATPNALPNDHEMDDSPDDVIYHDELCHVDYLDGEAQHHMSAQTLWVYQCSNEDYPLSKEKWTRKWLKTLNWDRWDYPGTEEHVKHTFGNKHLTLEILFIRAVLEVVWSNGNISTVNCGDVIPAKLGSVWHDTMRLHPGSIVKNSTEFTKQSKYGIITNLVGPDNALVKWITPEYNSSMDCDENSSLCAGISTELLYNLTEIPEYEYIQMPSQCPLVNCGTNGKVGVVLGTRPENFKVRVKLVDQTEEFYWPHELTHYKCDVLLCPIENRWTVWYAHMVPPDGITQVTPWPDSNSNYQFDTETCNTSLNLAFSTWPRKFECVQIVPSDNLFVNEEIRPRTRETNFHQAMEQEIAELENKLPDGMWVEYYTERGDIFSAVVTGPKGSVFGDLIFIFDIFIMENFPRSGPHINFRSMGLTLIPGHLCKSFAVFLPEESRLLEEDLTLSSVLNVLLELKDFLGVPLENIHENNKLSTVGIRPEDPIELYKFVTLAVLDYALAILQSPPRNWRPVIINHFADALPRVIKRFKKGGFEIKRAVATLSNEKGDLPQAEEYEKVTVPWDGTFLEAINSRIVLLEKIHASINE